MFNTADLFDEFDTDPLEQLSVESRIEYLQGWHRELTDEINEVSRKLHRIETGREKREDSKDLESLSADLKIRRAELDQKLIELIEDPQGKPGKAKVRQAKPEADSASAEAGLVAVRYTNREIFVADIIDYAMKTDDVSMEAPIFTLATKPDLSIWHWTGKSKNGEKWLTVTPSVLGRATMHDKDILIFAISQMVAARNLGREDANNRRIQFPAHTFLVSTNRGCSGDDYKRLTQALNRLSGTRITTNIATGDISQDEAFGLIDSWKAIRNNKTGEMISVEVTISEWLFNAVRAFEILTINPNYFRLRKPLARRLYEIARKHCGTEKAEWPMYLAPLKEKCGSRSSIKEFRRMVKAVEADGSLPDYRIEVLSDDRVMFYSKKFKAKDAQK